MIYLIVTVPLSLGGCSAFGTPEYEWDPFMNVRRKTARGRRKTGKIRITEMKRKLLYFSAACLMTVLFAVCARAEGYYWISVDKGNQTVEVYRTSDNLLVHRWRCSTGSNPTSTPEGTFYLPEPPYTSDRTGMFLSADGSYISWITRIRGAILFHTYLYDSASAETLDLESVYAIGTPVSHGCIRLCVEGARWIAQNCPPGTRVEIFTGDGEAAGATLEFPSSARRVTVIPNEKTDIAVGESVTLTAVTEPEGCTGTWVSTVPRTAKVSQDGTVTGLRDGTAEIVFVTENGKTASVTVDVHDYSVLRSVTVEEGKEITLQPGETLQLHPVVMHEGLSPVFTWSSSARDIATVSSGGLVTAVKDGTAKVTVKLQNGVSDTVTVTVVDPAIPQWVKLDENEITVNIGESVCPTYTVYPDTAEQGVRWTASTLDYFSISNGVITGKKAGTTTMSVRTLVGDRKDTLTVHVVDPSKPASVSIIGEKKLLLAAGETLQLQCEVLPDTAQTGLKWGSSATAYVRVDADTGLVTARAPGTATVSVTTSVLSKKDSVTITVYDPSKVYSVTPLDGNSVILHTGDIYTPEYTQFPEDRSGNCKITVGSTAVLSIENGTVTALKAGTANLTITAESGAKAVISVTVHDIRATEEIPAGCETEGFSAGFYCDRCRKYTQGRDPLPAAGHIFEPAFCRPAGSGDGAVGSIACRNCELSIREERVIPADGVLLVPAAGVIEEEAFCGCAEAQVIIAQGTRVIGKGAFRDDPGLLLIVIPDSVTDIAEDAFDGCTEIVFMCGENSAAWIYAKEHGICCYTGE